MQDHGLCAGAPKAVPELPLKPGAARQPSASLPSSASRRWWQDVLDRSASLWWLKAAGTTALMSLFFVGYFHTLRHPASPVIEMPLTALDHWLPFQPQALPLYVSLWFYVALPPALLRGLRSLLAYGFWVTALCVTGLICFYLWPTAVPVRLLPTDFPGFALLQGVDAAANACPSLHVATAVFSAVWLDRILKAIGGRAGVRLVNAVWALAITYSTLAIRQHVALDVLAGALLGLVFAWASLRWRPQSGAQP